MSRNYVAGHYIGQPIDKKPKLCNIEIGNHQNNRKKMYRPTYYQISPRHLLFNLLAHHKGKISRKELMNDILKAGSVLAAKGYKIPVTLKGSPESGFWSDNIDSELYEWSRFGLIRDEDKSYVFAPKEKPFDDLRNILEILNDSLEPGTRTALEAAIIHIHKK